MWCINCGAPLIAGEDRCSRCDTLNAVSPIAQGAEAMRRSSSGIPFDRYGVSLYGPVVAPDPLLNEPDSIDTLPPPQRYIGYRPVVTPPPPQVHKRHGNIARALLLVTLLLLVGLFIAVFAFHVNANVHFHLGAILHAL